METQLKPPKKPCGSCPYVTTTPSGIWDESEYRKLPAYDNPTPLQPVQVFMCHQRTGCVCGGWLMTHDTGHLLALRIARNVHPDCFDYLPPDVQVHESGQAACEHGLKDINNPTLQAKRKINGLLKLTQQ